MFFHERFARAHEQLANGAIRDGQTSTLFRAAAQRHANAACYVLFVAAIVWYFAGWKWTLIPGAYAAFRVIQSISSTSIAVRLEKYEGTTKAKPAARGRTLTAIAMTEGERVKSPIEIISKEEAARVFAMSKAQWLKTARDAHTAGAAWVAGSPEVGVCINTQTAEGDTLSVKASYVTSDKRPDEVQIGIGYCPPRDTVLSDGAIRDAMAKAAKQMRPEYIVLPNFERSAKGLMAFFLIKENRQN